MTIHACIFEEDLMTQNGVLDHRSLYRLPWSLPDNAISWLEPTSACNLACDGCYRENVPHSHKSLDLVRREIETFLAVRNSDALSIAGGDPLMHPDIVEIVRMASERGFKPVVNTNGDKLTRELLVELKRAGATGFTFHIDSKQGRPGWKGKDELGMNELRLEYAELLASVGGLSCAFNSTVYEDTLCFTPDLVEWAARHIDIVQVMVFILFRAATPQLPFDWYTGGRKIDMDVLAYSDPRERKIDLKSNQVVAEIRKRFSDFAPCAYLNGTEEPGSFKWLLTGRIGSRSRVYGYVGPKFMELIQTFHHFTNGRYLAYVTPETAGLGRLMLLLSAFDSGIRHTAGRYLAEALADPRRLFDRLHYQSIMIIQPVDFLANGLQSMCDGCPDMTLWNGELVWSCRMEELKHFGGWVRSVPRDMAASK